MAGERLDLSFSPLTPERWADFESLFGERGACGGCWCMLWRTSRSAFESGKGEGNKSAMRAIVESGAKPGLLAYAGALPVGWCAVAPRECYPALDRSRLFKAVDDTPVWSVSCLFVRKSHRGRGVSVELLRAAVRFVAAQGGAVVEGYPIEPRSDSVPAAFAWTGLASAFLRAGFQEHRRGSATRPVMRFWVTPESDAEPSGPPRPRGRTRRST
jgi:GNAT superfamily N-acetyltransferase